VPATTSVAINFRPLALRVSAAKMVTTTSSRAQIFRGGGLFRDSCRQSGASVRLFAMTCRGRTRTQRHASRWLRPRAPLLSTDDEEAVVERRGAGVVPRRETLSALHHTPSFLGS
jgi:hypothetical protein